MRPSEKSAHRHQRCALPLHRQQEFEVAGEMGAADAATQGAFLLPEEVLEDVIGAVNDAKDLALVIASNRVSEQMSPMSIESFENNALG